MSFNDISRAVVEGNEEDALALCTHMLDVEKVPAIDIVNKGLAEGLRIMGEGMKRGDFYLAEVVLSAHVTKVVFEVLKPYFKTGGTAKLGTVVIGTVQGDIHDIGKNLVATMLEAGGFEVFDLGVDVHSDRFVEAAKDRGADIVAMSALLTSTMVQMEEVIAELEKSGIRSNVKVMVGGAPLTTQYAAKIGADAYGEDCFNAVSKAQELLQK